MTWRPALESTTLPEDALERSDAPSRMLRLPTTDARSRLAAATARDCPAQAVGNPLDYADTVHGPSDRTQPQHLRIGN